MSASDVRQAFARAADRYDAMADFQQQVGLRLLADLPWSGLHGLCLDLGCGTGHGSGLLTRAFPGLELLALDFALPMVARRPAASLRLCADAQALPLADACVDACWSSLAMQWCDPGRFLAEAARVLKPGGRIALSTLGPNTFAELRQAFAAVDGYRHTIDFCDEAALRQALTDAGLALCRWQRRTITLHRPDLRGLLAGVRDLGANRVRGDNRRSGLMGKTAWQRLLAAYEALRQPEGLPLSYDTFFLYAEKAASSATP